MQQQVIELSVLSRRALLLGGAALGAFASTPSHAVVMSSGSLRTLVEMMEGVEGFNGHFEQFKKARVDLQMTLLADNGNSVPLSVEVNSAMSEEEHITDIYLLSQRNPVLVMARFHWVLRLAKPWSTHGCDWQVLKKSWPLLAPIKASGSLMRPRWS